MDAAIIPSLLARTVEVIVGIVTRSVRILFSHSTESRPAEGASNDDRSSVRAGLPRAIASATSRLRPPTCRTRAVPRFPPPSDALLSRWGSPASRKEDATASRCPALRFAKLAFNADVRRDARAGRPPIRAEQGLCSRRGDARAATKAGLVDDRRAAGVVTRIISSLLRPRCGRRRRGWSPR